MLRVRFQARAGTWDCCADRAGGPGQPSRALATFPRRECSKTAVRADPTPGQEPERKKASLGQRAQLADLRDVLVTSTTDAQEHPLVRTPSALLGGDPRHGMGGFQGGDDSLETTQQRDSP